MFWICAFYMPMHMLWLNKQNPYHAGIFIDIILFTLVNFYTKIYGLLTHSPISSLRIIIVLRLTCKVFASTFIF